MHPVESYPQSPGPLQYLPWCPVVEGKSCLDCRAQGVAHSLPPAGCLLSGSLTSSWGRGEGGSWGGGWVENPGVAERREEGEEETIFGTSSFKHKRAVTSHRTTLSICVRAYAAILSTCRWYQICAGLSTVGLDGNHTQEDEGNPLR